MARSNQTSENMVMHRNRSILKAVTNHFSYRNSNFITEPMKIQLKKGFRTHEIITKNKKIRQITMKNDERNRECEWDESDGEGEDENNWY
jgi:hypothetical protein